MASLSSKRKTITNRQLQRREPRAKVPQQATAALFGRADAPAFGASTFDDTVYASLKPRFRAALPPGHDEIDIRLVMRALVQQEFDAGGRDGANSLRPYIIKYVDEYRECANGKPTTALAT